MLNLSQATVSIGFSIRNGARARNLVSYIVRGVCLCGPGADKIFENRRPRLDQYH
jgi:hypothetical protein